MDVRLLRYASRSCDNEGRTRRSLLTILVIVEVNSMQGSYPKRSSSPISLSGVERAQRPRRQSERLPREHEVIAPTIAKRLRGTSRPREASTRDIWGMS